MIVYILGSASVVLVAGCIYRFAKWPYFTLQKLGIPVVKGGHYFVGHVLEEKDYDHVGVYDLDMFKKYGDTFGLVEFDTPVIITRDSDLLKEVLFNNFQNFTGRRKLYLRKWMRHSLLDVEGHEWKRTRSMLTPFFSSAKLKNNLPLIRKCSKLFLENIERIQLGKQSVDVQDICATFALDVICSTAFGLQVDSQNNPNDAFLLMLKKLQNISFESLLVFTVFTFPFLSPILEFFGVSMFPPGYLKFFEMFTNQLIKERRSNPQKRNDFVHAMVKAHLEDMEHNSEETRKGLTNEEILAQTLTFILAGYDTTSKTLAFFLHCVAVNQDSQTRVYNEIMENIGNEELTYNNVHKLEYLEMCLSESLRLFPPIFRFDRRATSDVKVGDLLIRKGVCVVAPVWALHRNPNVWSDPDKFDPERFTKEACAKRNQCMFMPFGAGLRNCIGMRMALMTIKTVVVETLRKFRIVPSEKTENPVKLRKYVILIQAENGIHLGFENR